MMEQTSLFFYYFFEPLIFYTFFILRVCDADIKTESNAPKSKDY